mgnify:CR=1 FL=1
MKKLNLQGKKRSDLISDFKNQIARYTDILCEKNDGITYAEHIIPHKGKEVIPGMEYEDYVDSILLDAWSPNKLGGTGNRIKIELLNKAKPFSNK